MRRARERKNVHSPLKNIANWDAIRLKAIVKPYRIVKQNCTQSIYSSRKLILILEESRRQPIFYISHFHCINDSFTFWYFLESSYGRNVKQHALPTGSCINDTNFASVLNFILFYSKSILNTTRFACSFRLLLKECTWMKVIINTCND